MVDVPVNENIDDYKVTVIAGLTAVQVISAICSVIVGGVEFLIFNLALGWDMTICAFIILPTVALLVFGINFNQDELNIIEYVKQGRWKKRKMFLGYASTETLQNYCSDAEEWSSSHEEAEQRKEEEFQALARKMIFAMVFAVVLILGVVVFLIAAIF